jgi:predicted transcriptional regulator
MEMKGWSQLQAACNLGVSHTRIQQLLSLLEAPKEFKELKLRLNCKSDEEVKKILRRLYNLTKPELKLKETEEDRTYRNITVGVFKQEPISAISFIRNNLSFLLNDV